MLTVPNVPKDPSRGEHTIPFTKVVYIERADFREVSSCVVCNVFPITALSECRSCAVSEYLNYNLIQGRDIDYRMTRND